MTPAERIIAGTVITRVLPRGAASANEPPEALASFEFPPVSAYEDDPPLAPVRLGESRPDIKPTQDHQSRQIILRPIHEIVSEEREPEWLIHKVLEAKILGVLAGPRSTFKSFIALHWAMTCAVAGHTVVILSGEGAGLDRRIAAWILEHGRTVDVQTLSIVALERPLNLNLAGDLSALATAIGVLDRKPNLILIDTLSKFSAGLDENSNFEVAKYLSSLTDKLRDAFGCTVLLVAHTGHGDAKRPRGASALMANPDAEYIVDRPNPTSMTVTVSRERFKDAPALPPLAYEARVVPLGRLDRYGEPVTSLVLCNTDAPTITSKGKAAGKNQQAVITALKEWARSSPESNHISTDQLGALVKAQNIVHNRKPEVLRSLTQIGVLTSSVGGYIVNKDLL